jgi:signal transduction histidine kinase
MRTNLSVIRENWLLALLARPSTHAIAALVASLAMMGYVAHRWHDDTARAMAKFRQETSARNADAAEAAQFQVSLLYHGLRAIARSPGLKTLDRGVTDLDPAARRGVQDLVSDLASNVAISNVYVTLTQSVIGGLDRRKGLPNQPVISFKGRGERANAPTASRLRGALDTGPDAATSVEAQTRANVRAHLAAFQTAHSTLRSFRDLGYPARGSLGSGQPTLVYSLPFYGPDGRLRGAVSGVVPATAMAAKLGAGGNHVLSERETMPPVAATTGDVLFVVRSSVKAAGADGGWIVTTQGLRADFQGRDDVAAARRMAAQGFGLAAVLTLALLLAARMHRRFATRAFDREASLDAMIRTRTTELNAKLRELEAHRAALEAARQQAIQASEAKSQFLANMSHELRTPLNAILGFSDMMMQEIRGPLGHASYKGYAGDIHKSGAHLLSLINDILDLSKIEAGRFELHQSIFNPHETFQSAIGLLSLRAGDAGVTLHNQVSPHFDLSGDERAMQQIALNLLTNALKFTPPGGSVHAQSYLDATWLTLKIIDTGKGIAPDDLDRVFESFGQGRHDQASADRGTGLGLPIVRGLIQAHGGDVRIESQVGRGTTVVIRLPAALVLPAAAAA